MSPQPKSLKDILSSYSEVDFQELSREAHKSSINCGKTHLACYSLSDKDWDIIDNISNEIWYSDFEIETKFQIGLEFFELLPSYFSGLAPYYESLRDGLLTPNLQSALWSKFYTYLTGKPSYKDPTGYVLWAEFFEDHYGTCKASWEGMLSYCSENNNPNILLELSGPVPWEDKIELYKSASKDPDDHNLVLRALALSATEVYGQFNAQEAKQLLSELKVDKTSVEYEAVIEALSKS